MTIQCLYLEQCSSYNIPVFVKQLGTHLAKELGLKARHGGDMEEWPEQLRVRQWPRGADLIPFFNHRKVL